MRTKLTTNQKIGELMTRLAAVGKELDTAQDADAMRHWIRERRWVRRAIEALGPPRQT